MTVETRYERVEGGFTGLGGRCFFPVAEGERYFRGCEWEDVNGDGALLPCAWPVLDAETLEVKARFTPDDFPTPWRVAATGHFASARGYQAADEYCRALNAEGEEKAAQVLAALHEEAKRTQADWKRRLAA